MLLSTTKQLTTNARPLKLVDGPQYMGRENKSSIDSICIQRL